MPILQHPQKTPKRSADFSGLPQILLERLHGANVFDVADWLRLTPTQRRGIWGVTAAHIALIDRAVGARS